MPDARGGPTLRALQDVQARFDADRGLDFTDADPLARLSFAVLALCGEAGELANAVKKAQRASWLGDDPAPHRATAVAEIADVLAYLLKVASLLGADVDEVYLTKMSDNCLRFVPRAQSGRGRLLTIAGPSASGKTTLARALAAELPVFIECVDNNPYLPSLFHDPTAFNALSNQRWFLRQIVDFVERADPTADTVLDQDPMAVVRVYARMFRDDGYLSQASYNMLLADLLALESQLAGWSGGRTILFLDASAATLRRRAQRRGDSHVPSEAWFERVRTYFGELQTHTPDARVIWTEDQEIDSVILYTLQVLKGR